MAALASAKPRPSSGRKKSRVVPQCTKISLEMVQRNDYCALQQIRRNNHMADDNKVEAQAAAEAPAKVAEAVADTAATLVQQSAKVAKRERAVTQRRVKREASVQKTVARRSKAVRRKTRTAARKKSAAAQKRIETVTNNTFFNGFEAVPAFAPFQSLFVEANERSQELAKKTQKVAEELADLARANVEALVEAGRVASEGARSIGQDVVATSRDRVEQTADAIRSLAEAKSPTEYLQLQGEFARASFDRSVAETSKLTESLVKLAGEAFQPLSNRATANAERFNTLVA
jgi:phasin family protein